MIVSGEVLLHSKMIYQRRDVYEGIFFILVASTIIRDDKTKKTKKSTRKNERIKEGGSGNTLKESKHSLTHTQFSNLIKGKNHSGFGKEEKKRNCDS